MTSRRELLKGSVALAAGAIGLGAAGRAIARHDQPAQPTSGTQELPLTLTLAGRNWHALTDSTSGRQTTLSGELVDQEGTSLGAFYGSAARVESPVDHSPASVETHTFALADGTIHGMGTVAPGAPEAVFAVVGGTGRYLGARGSYVARQQPLELGGDGSASFTLTFTR
jgi:hypothetical protein